MKNEELASYGIRAYQGGEYSTAIEFLKMLVEREPQLWTCRLYLAMSYHRAGQTGDARKELTTISEWATDHSIRRKALDALRAVNAAMPDVRLGRRATQVGH